MSDLRYKECQLHQLQPIFKAYEDILDELIAYDNRRTDRTNVCPAENQVADELRNLKRQLRMLSRNRDYLLTSAKSMSASVADGLNLRNQLIVSDQSRHLFELSQTTQEMTRATVRDSGTIRVITIATLVFLPVTSVAVSHLNLQDTGIRILKMSQQTLFGTEMFYLTDDHTLAVSDQIWLLVAIATPLTVLTITFWLLCQRKIYKEWPDHPAIRVQADVSTEKVDAHVRASRLC
jgi:hypothetical protein